MQVRKYPPPVVSESSVGTDLLEALKVLTQLVVQLVRQHLTEPTVLDVLLTIEEPVRNLVLAGVGHHCDYPLHLHTNRNLSLYKKIPTNTGLWILSTRTKLGCTYYKGVRHHHGYTL